MLLDDLISLLEKTRKDVGNLPVEIRYGNEVQLFKGTGKIAWLDVFLDSHVVLVPGDSSDVELESAEVYE